MYNIILCVEFVWVCFVICGVYVMVIVVGSNNNNSSSSSSSSIINSINIFSAVMFIVA